jgi:hypothetical protein
MICENRLFPRAEFASRNSPQLEQPPGRTNGRTTCRLPDLLEPLPKEGVLVEAFQPRRAIGRGLRPRAGIDSGARRESCDPEIAWCRAILAATSFGGLG